MNIEDIKDGMLLALNLAVSIQVDDERNDDEIDLDAERLARSWIYVKHAPAGCILLHSEDASAVAEFGTSPFGLFDHEVATAEQATDANTPDCGWARLAQYKLTGE